MWSLLFVLSRGVHFPLYYPILLVGGACGLVAVGWIVGRLHRRAHLAGVVAFVAIVLLLSSAVQFRLAASAFVSSGNGVIPWWAQFALRQWLWGGSIVLGALLSADGPRAQTSGQLPARSPRIANP